MTLSMKNYKGYDKKPYCVAHYPQTKATVVADTPEMARIAHNTKIQSQVNYHAAFEKMKGSKIEVVDDPELLRVKKVASIVSQVGYKTNETRRQSLPMAANTPVEAVRNSSSDDHKPSPYSDRAVSHSTVYTSSGSKVNHAAPVQRIGSIADYDPLNENYGSLTHGYEPTSRSNSMTQEWEETVPISPASAHFQPALTENTEEGEERKNNDNDQVIEEPLPVDIPTPARNEDPPAVRTSTPPPTNDDDPATDAASTSPPPAVGEPEEPSAVPVSTTNADHDREPPAMPVPSPNVLKYRAMYAYEAQDDDEVGFDDGDVISDVEIVADGWMIGTVEKTGLRGMMPSNYVEEIPHE
jgi:hypothetical protein